MGKAGALAVCLLATSPALASEPSSDPAPAADGEGAPDEEGPRRFDWYDAYAHAVRLDIPLGRWTGRDLGAGGLGLQWEWWPTGQLSYAARAWIQTIHVQSRLPDGAPAIREASGITLDLQLATPGSVKALAGAGVGMAFVNGRLPPSDRWRNRAVPLAGVVEAHAGFVLMSAPVTVHALAWVHLYSEGPPVLSLSFGGGPMLTPGKGIDER